MEAAAEHQYLLWDLQMQTGTPQRLFPGHEFYDDAGREY